MAQSTRKVLWNLVLISVGSALAAVAINGILIPKEFISAGFTGLAIVIHYLVPSLPVSVMYFILNVPLFALGWMFVGRRFFLYSIAGMAIFSIVVAFVNVPIHLEDKMLSALLAGIMTGAGSGLILRSVGSAGGLDILSVIFLNRYSVRLGTTVLAFNSILLAAAVFLFSLEIAIYTLVYMYVSTHIMNIVVSGLSQRKSVLIVSTKWQEIAQGITREINRGFTVIPGEGGYSGKEERILYTVLAFQELPELKQIIRRADPNAFVVINNTLEVMGHRIGNQPPLVGTINSSVCRRQADHVSWCCRCSFF